MANQIHPQRVQLAGMPVRFARTPVKNINLRIAPESGEIRVSAPHGVDLARIEAFLASRKAWIETVQSRLEQSRGEVFEPSERDRAELRRRIAHLAPGLEERVGARASEYRVRKMRTRWGSCNTLKRRIWISLELVRYPLECLEYVLVHELVHLHEPSHNARFHRLVEAVLPDWKERRRKLRLGPGFAGID